MIRIVSLNVNGLRAFAKKNTDDFNSFCLNDLKADILCLQEVKGTYDNLLKFHSLKDYHTFSSFYHKKGRHGVSTLIKKTLFCNKTEEIIKGRILKTFHGNFVLYNCYLPYFDETTENDKTEVIETYQKLSSSLDKNRCIICGDLNACYNMMDHYQFVKEYKRLVSLTKWINPHIYEDECDSKNFSSEIKLQEKNDHEAVIKNFKSEKILVKINNILSNDEVNGLKKFKLECEKYGIVCSEQRMQRFNAGPRDLPYFFFTVLALEEYFFSVFQRDWLRKLLTHYKDTFRIFNDELEQYTCWNTLLNNREYNLGTRIDYILSSNDIDCTNSEIMSHIMGSDHCPIFSDFNIENYSDDKTNIVKKKNNILDYFSKKN